MEYIFLGLGHDLETPRMLMSLCFAGAIGIGFQRLIGRFIKPRDQK